MPSLPTVRLTRRVAFSAGHRYWRSDIGEKENRALYGEWASPYNHGHNYVVDVSVEGSVDERSGMVVNIKRIDDVLQELIVARFDGKSINDEVPGFEKEQPSIENLLQHIWDLLAPALPKQVRLKLIRVEETPLLYGELTDEHMTLTRVYEFAASHRLHSDLLSQAENDELFGKCNNPLGHGHNFVLEVTVQGRPVPVTGMIADIGEIDRIVSELVVDRYDHKHLNEDIPEFKGRIVTSEILVAEIFKILDGKLPAKLHRVRLHETARNIFEVTA